jgi:hypothetical protein
MKKLLNQIKDAFENYQIESKEKQSKKDFEIAINGMMKVAFSKDTVEAIKRKEAFVKAFDSEIAKRGLDAQIEGIDCEEYFNKQKKSLQYG